MFIQFFSSIDTIEAILPAPKLAALGLQHGIVVLAGAALPPPLTRQDVLQRPSAL